MELDGTARSFFCTLNNPAEHGFTGTPEEIAEQIKELWIKDNPQRTCAITYCISADGLPHCHAVFENVTPVRFSVIKKLFPSMHIEATKGNKAQAEDYIHKRGKHEEKGEIVVCTAFHGEIKGFQGQRKDLDAIQDLLDQGLDPEEIKSQSLSYRRHSRLIDESYYAMRLKVTPLMREVKSYWHVGESGTGKSYTYIQLCEEHGKGKIYRVTDYKNPFDLYNGEPILFVDEFRGQMPFNLFLMLLDVYDVQLPCRYANKHALWDKVHITSPMSPEQVYAKMVEEHRDIDNIEQLLRRLTSVIYHSKEDGEYRTFEQPAAEYEDYAALKYYAQHQDTPPLITPDWVQTLVTDTDTDIEELSS